VSQPWAFFLTGREAVMLSLEEAKKYLRVDSQTMRTMLSSRNWMLLRALWRQCSERKALEDENSPIVVVAVLYALAYLNEHREEADHHALTITLRNLLFGERDARF
jgi:hypothetical protein